MRVLVIGCGANVERELSQVDRSSFDCIIGVNRAALLYGPVDLHVTLHPETYARQKQARLISWRAMEGVDEVFDFAWRKHGNSGSSGLYAVKYALERLNAESVTLAGVGIDKGPHIYSTSDWAQAEQFQKTWIEVVDKLRGRVFSLGGWTAKLLNEE